MKLKLKVSKNLKRDLRKLAEGQDVERMVYILNAIEKHLEDNSTIWKPYVDDYPALLEKRQLELIALKESLEEEEDSFKRVAMKEFYQENHMYVDLMNKQRKFENLIIPLSEQLYYGLCLLAEDKKMTVERFTVELLTITTKNS